MPQKVLVLEPNSRMLEVIRHGIGDMVELRAGASLLHAKAIMNDWMPDLVLSEYRLSDGTGLELLDHMRRIGEGAPPVTMLASRADAVDRLGPHVAHFEEIIQKPFFATELRERVKRALGRASLRRAGTGDSGPLRGRLEDMSVVDLLQALDLSHKTCAVSVIRQSGTRPGERKRDEETALLLLVDGQVKDAQLGAERGDQVVYKVLGWTEGEFALDFNRKPTETTVKNSTQGLLMEGLRQLDESAMAQ